MKPRIRTPSIQMSSPKGDSMRSGSQDVSPDVVMTCPKPESMRKSILLQQLSKSASGVKIERHSSLPTNNTQAEKTSISVATSPVHKIIPSLARSSTCLNLNVLRTSEPENRTPQEGKTTANDKKKKDASVTPKFTFSTLRMFCAAIARFKMNKTLREQVNKMMRADEIRKIKAIFNKYQHGQRSNKIELWDLRKVLREVGIMMDEDELLHFVQEELKENDGTIDYNTFMKIVISQKKLDNPMYDDETLFAFVAMGGNPDKTGEVLVDRLENVVNEFGLPIDIVKLLQELDEDGNGSVDFDEFSKLLLG